MRIYKKTYRSADGEAREYSKYTVEIRDIRGKARRFTGYKDRRMSETLGKKIEALVCSKKTGEPLTADLARWLEIAPENLKAHLLRCGLLEARQAAAGVGLADLLGQFLDTLRLKGRSVDYIADVRLHVQRIFDGCGFQVWSDCTVGKLEGFLDVVRQQGRSNRTLNKYVANFKTFQNWLLNRDLITKPMPGLRALEKFDENLDRRKIRRAMSEQELEALFRAARERPLAEARLLNRGPRKGKPGARLTAETREKLRMLGWERSLCYKCAFLTGLRRKELRSIRVTDVHLKAIPQKIVLAAKDEKARRGAELPLRADLASELRSFIEEKGLAPDDRLFDMPNLRTLKRDLRFAGIEIEDADGRSVDFHGLRMSFASHLSRAGVGPRTAQAALRHSDISLTMKVYTDPQLLDVAGALDALPKLKIDGGSDAKKIG